jgi:hypothetical protein
MAALGVCGRTAMVPPIIRPKLRTLVSFEGAGNKIMRAVAGSLCVQKRRRPADLDVSS